MNGSVTCPVCNRLFNSDIIEEHVNKCIFLNSEQNTNIKRNITTPEPSHSKKRPKPCGLENESPIVKPNRLENTISSFESVPLAERMRPSNLSEFVGQKHVLGSDKILRILLLKKDIPSMILWGPPGCGKTSLANVISSICKTDQHMRFVKLSATMSSVNDVREVVTVAKNELKFNRKTILFMDEIHRFNKSQQDTFLPHIESGNIILIGATTENPSFSLNSALLSRCRVIVMEKLSIDDILSILDRALKIKYEALILNNGQEFSEAMTKPKFTIERKSVTWLAEICDGDARIGLNSLQLAIQAKETTPHSETTHVTLEDIKDGIKRSHILYDRKGEEHYNMISAMHKAIRASDGNAALYWLTRMMEGGEDPLYIARRLVRIAGEDIGLADSKALSLAVSCMQGCQLIGMPECDVLLAQCAVYLARTPKSTEVYHALLKCKQNIAEHKGPLPSVPLHLRNASTNLMSRLGYGKGYNTKHMDISNLKYMPEGMEDVDLFH